MKTLAISLSSDEALVFFEWLASLEDKLNAGYADGAEQTVIWRVEGQLETLVPEVVQENYRQKIRRAKDGILGRSNSDSLLP